MNRKAEIGIGLLIISAVAIILGLVILQPIATNVEQGTRTNTGLLTNLNYTVAAVAGTTYELTGQELGSVIFVANKTGGESVATTNYTVNECVRTSNGLKGICYKAISTYGGAGVNVSYTYYPDGYIDNAGARSITGIIVLLAAIAIMLVAFLGIRKIGE